MVIEPGTAEDPTIVTLLAVPSPSSTSYDTVPYVWGNAEDTLDILCNGEPFPVTTNLYWALQHVRHTSQPRHIWVDAVCINQQDLVERSSQVAMMGTIYSSAEIVYVCLGDSPEHDDVLAQAIIEKALHQRNAGSDENRPKLLDLRHEIAWYDIGRLTRNRWFQRAWVVQEAGFARNPRILYGDVEFGYRDLIDVLNWTRQFTWAMSGGDSWVVNRKWADWSKPNDDDGLTFLDLLSHSCYLKCLDPRDHIYAFLAHPLARSVDSIGLLVEPDYGKDPVQVYLDATAVLLRRFGVRLLSMVEHTEATLNSDWPSWILRWDACEALNDIDDARTEFCASAGLEAPLAIDGDHLVMQGVIIDKVDDVLEIVLYRGDDVTFYHEETCISLKELLQRLSTRFGSHILHALAKTLSVGASSLGAALEPAMERLAHALDTSWEDFGEHNSQIQENDLMFWERISAYVGGRCLIVTEQGTLGLAPRLTRPGDRCCIMLGANVPCIIQPGDDGYSLLGEAYMHGYMSGEIQEELTAGTATIETLVLR